MATQVMVFQNVMLALQLLARLGIPAAERASYMTQRDGKHVVAWDDGLPAGNLGKRLPRKARRPDVEKEEKEPEEGDKQRDGETDEEYRKRRRMRRSKVRVDGVVYNSATVAFKVLGLSWAGFEKFRNKLKAAKTLTAYGHEWVDIPTNW